MARGEIGVGQQNLSIDTISEASCWITAGELTIENAKGASKGSGVEGEEEGRIGKTRMGPFDKKSRIRSVEVDWDTTEGIGRGRG